MKIKTITRIKIALTSHEAMFLRDYLRKPQSAKENGGVKFEREKLFHALNSISIRGYANENATCQSKTTPT